MMIESVGLTYCENYSEADETCEQCVLHKVMNHNSCYKPVKKESKQKVEHVNHPTHYNIEGRRECIEEMRLMFGDEAVKSWCILTAYKYRYRAGNKQDNSAAQDNAKAEWYLNYVEQMQKNS